MATPRYPQGPSAASGIWLAFKVIVALSFGSCCLCGIGLTALGAMVEDTGGASDPVAREDDGQQENPVLPAEPRQGSRPSEPKQGGSKLRAARDRVVLAEAHVPADEDNGAAVKTFSYRTKSVLPPSHWYSVRFTEEEADRLAELHAALGRKMNYRLVSKEEMRFVAEDECFVDYGCVYRAAWRDQEDAVHQLAAPFIARAEEAGLTSVEAADVILSFVQSLPYLESDTYAFDLTPAALVVRDEGGDCDSKALLGVMLLRELGIDATLLMAFDRAHAALGLGLPLPGDSVRHDGRKYVYVEMTQVAPIGFVPSHAGRVSQYRAVVLP